MKLSYPLRTAAAVASAVFVCVCAPVAQAKDSPAKREVHSERGHASYYAKKFEGRRTASGKTFRHSELMAAHNKLPFGTLVRVTNLRNDSSVDVRIADRGGFGKGASTRIIDLSRSAAERLGMIAAGQVRVVVEVLEWGGRKSMELADTVLKQAHISVGDPPQPSEVVPSLQAANHLATVKQD